MVPSWPTGAFSILTAIFCIFSCSLSIDSKSWVIRSCRAWSRSVRFLAFFLSTSPMDTSIAHSRCFLNLEYSPHTAPTRPVLWLTPAVNDSTALDVLFTAEPTVSRLRQRSCWRVCKFWMRISSFALEPFNAAIIDVTPIAKAVVEARRLAGSLGSGSGTLGLGDLDRSSSLSSLSAGDLLPSSGWGIPCSSPFSDSASTVPACAGSGRFSDRGNSDAAGSAAFAMNLSRRRVRAWCTRWERPGPRYSLGILCVPTSHSNLVFQLASTMQPDVKINHSTDYKLPSSHPKVCDAHLNRWFTFPTKITLTTTPRCVPHILTGNMWSTKLQCLRQNKNNANLWQTANLIHIQLPMHAQLFTKLQNRSQWFLRIKPIDMSCSKNENSCKARDSWQNYSRWVPQVQVPSSPKSSKTLKFQDISRIVIPLQSQLDSSFVAAFAFLLTAVGGFQA